VTAEIRKRVKEIVDGIEGPCLEAEEEEDLESEAGDVRWNGEPQQLAV